MNLYDKYDVRVADCDIGAIEELDGTSFRFPPDASLTTNDEEAARGMLAYMRRAHPDGGTSYRYDYALATFETASEGLTRQFTLFGRMAIVVCLQTTMTFAGLMISMIKRRERRYGVCLSVGAASGTLCAELACELMIVTLASSGVGAIVGGRMLESQARLFGTVLLRVHPASLAAILGMAALMTALALLPSFRTLSALSPHRVLMQEG